MPLTVADFFGEASVSGLARRIDSFDTAGSSEVDAMSVILPMKTTGVENWSLPGDHDGMLNGSALLDIGEVVGGALVEP